MHFTSSDTFCTAVNEKTRTQRGIEVERGVVGEEKDSKSEVEGRKEDQGMKREGKEERIKEGLKFLTLRGKEKKSLNI